MIVFTDSFTVGADVDPASYPATPDYSYLLGTAGDCEVVAASDRLDILTTGADKILRLLNAACPTGDQEITLRAQATAASGASGYAVTRCDPATSDCYFAFLDMVPANEVELYRMTAGSPTLVASADRGFTADGAYTYRFKATGTNPVALEFQVDATAVVTFNDSDAARKQSGRPGCGGFTTVIHTNWVDDISVSDLIDEASPFYRVNRSSVPPNVRIAGG